MQPQTPLPGEALRAYEATAPFYDALTAHHDYERWLPRLIAIGRHYGLRGRRLLDVGCGTGKSFLPLQRAGWSVTACDGSPAMLRRARSKAQGQARLEVADLRRLPRFGAYDLVWAIDDAVNYLLDIDQLEACMSGLARNLAPGGRVMFDTNTLRMYRSFYSETEVHERGDHRLVWQGHGNGQTAPGSLISATFRVERRDGRAGVPSIAAVHRQRHFRRRDVVGAMARSDLECLAVLGQGLDGNAEEPLDEGRHTKAIFVGKRRQRR
jgi:SAM-dependent methyltransferase